MGDLHQFYFDFAGPGEYQDEAPKFNVSKLRPARGKNCDVSVDYLLLCQAATPFFNLDPGTTYMHKSSFEVQPNSAWHDYLAQCVSHIQYEFTERTFRCHYNPSCPGHDDAQFVVWVKPEYAEDWMSLGCDAYGTGVGNHEEIDEWAERFGLQARDFFVCVAGNSG